MKMKKIKITENHARALQLIHEAKKLGANIWSHPKGARGGKDEYDNVCEYCGKRSKDGEGNYFQILNSGLIIPNRIDEAIIWDLSNLKLIKDEPQGGFSIGSTCAKKLLKDKFAFYLNCKDDFPTTNAYSVNDLESAIFILNNWDNVSFEETILQVNYSND